MTTPIDDRTRLAIATRAEVIALEHHPYEYGEEGPYAYDCSGFLRRVWRGFADIPHNAALAAAELGMKPITAATFHLIKPGDAVFFPGSTGTKEKPGHVAVYLRSMGSLVVIAQAVDTAHGTEVTKMRRYGEPCGVGLIAR